MGSASCGRLEGPPKADLVGFPLEDVKKGLPFFQRHEAIAPNVGAGQSCLLWFWDVLRGVGTLAQFVVPLACRVFCHAYGLSGASMCSMWVAPVGSWRIGLSQRPRWECLVPPGRDVPPSNSRLLARVQHPSQG